MSSEREGKDSPLSEIADEEMSVVRERLTKELGRQPTREEMDEWLREHTESY
jgi:hypothetical protein